MVDLDARSALLSNTAADDCGALEMPETRGRTRIVGSFPRRPRSLSGRARSPGDTPMEDPSSMVVGPETREILQCLYAPRARQLRSPDDSDVDRTLTRTDAGGAASAHPVSVFTKQAILAAAIGRNPDMPTILDMVDPALPDRTAIVAAARALRSPQPAAAAPLLADVSMEHTLEFARAALGARAGVDARSTLRPAAVATMATDQTEVVEPDDELAQDEAVVEALRRSAKVDPIGFLHLERLHFTPVRYRKGDLVYSVTLMPGETVRLTHREWSKTEREFTSLVAETLENEQEQSVAEKSELTESNSTQRSHSMAFSASMNVSGNYGFVSFAANAGLKVDDQIASTKEVSGTQSRESTRKASSRAKKEHKVTFRIASTTETESTSFRELKNATGEAARWDFHRMMREWKVELYRYGLRLTYDVTIPEPGAYLLSQHLHAAQLTQRIATPVELPRAEDVQPEHREKLQIRYDVLLDPAPAAVTMHATATLTYGGTNDNQATGAIVMTVPDGFAIDPRSVVADAPIEAWKGWDGGSPPKPTSRTSYTDLREEENRQRLSGAPVAQPFSWRYTVYWTDHPNNDAKAVAGVRYVVEPSPATVAEWRSRSYARLVAVLRGRHEEEAAQLSQTRDALVQRLSGDDALALRRIEREEVMKSVLRWIFGPDFQFYPEDLPPGPERPTDESIVDRSTWRRTLRYGQLITFLHQAIEWENVAYVLYPYFWSEPTRWADLQGFRHYDPTHAEFLRAGAARVVITIRPGFERAWLHLAATGRLAEPNPNHDDDGSEYLSIAEEIKAAAHTYQPHTPGTNRLDQPGLLIDEWTEWTPTGALDVAHGGPLE
ncbi:hypothetical protein [Actinoplanes sp. NPDC049118]|uniref:hypothetical protein n=1 Tax=Actinoplanes sp. NPDC049118 TaxID=3155769 RepID=UPI0033E0C250